MSTKVTMILTNDNEHWYHDCNAAYYEETATKDAIVLEFDPRHKVEIDEEGARVIIEAGTPLYEALMAARWDHEAGQSSKGPVVTMDELGDFLKNQTDGAPSVPVVVIDKSE